MIITTGPNGEFAKHHLMVTLAQIQLDREIVNAHVTGNVNIGNMLFGGIRGDPNFDPVKYVKEMSHVKHTHADSILIHPISLRN